MPLGLAPALGSLRALRGADDQPTTLMVRGHRIASRGLDYDPLNLVIIIPNLHQELSTVNSLNSIKSKAVEGHKYL